VYIIHLKRYSKYFFGQKFHIAITIHQVYHHLRHNIQKKKYVVEIINSSWDNIQPMTNINGNINSINNSQLQAQ
jgi:hypothetical protein